ncbi:hypothetical protein SAMN05216452_1183 [Nitratireductor aquibiodomus]|uniref:Uncharacterized protein n=1 Tax=Nitratireductor aquibiodomus TaxID=204799 RepID=A0A1H4JAP2_9HYPH|nr:hypothetical protein [Nitratireductor aquibiodomus]SEB43323.1 hypothetical protein SAMN05216452_1183 [Nitratireductor aquibiodomus]
MRDHSALSIRLPLDVKAKLQLRAGSGSLNAEVIRMLKTMLDAEPVHFRLYQKNGFYVLDTGAGTEIHDVFMSKDEAVKSAVLTLNSMGLNETDLLDMTEKETVHA